MTDEDRDQFANHLEGLGLVFDREIADPLSEIYFRALKELPLETFAAAVNRAIATCTFFPKPAELLEIACGAPDDRALAAWLLLERAHREVGQSRSIYIADRALAVTLVDTFGGWIGYCEQMAAVFDYDNPLKQVAGLTPEMKRARQKEFVQRYRRAELTANQRAAHYQIGASESINRANAGGWKRGIFPEGRFSQAIGVIASGDIRIVPVEYDALTGALCECEAALIKEGNVRGLLALASGLPARLTATTPKMLPPAKIESITPAHAPLDPRNGIRLLRDQTRFPDSGGLSEGEYESRRRLLREQFQRLKREDEAIDVTL